MFPKRHLVSKVINYCYSYRILSSRTGSFCKAQRQCSTDASSQSFPFPGSRAKYISKMMAHDPGMDQPIPIYRVLDDHGCVIDQDEDPQLEAETLLKMYRLMCHLNQMDKIMEASQRQGLISFYLTNNGEEGLQVGSAAALDDRDWMFAQYREVGALMWRGFTLAQCVNQCSGNRLDHAKGRQLPVHYGSKEFNHVTISSPLATQIPQAPGAAYSFKRQKNGLCVMCYFGDGAASEGDAHAAFNFAAVLECPVIFFCRNNGYAISTPVEEQYRGDGVASRGSGYGMISIRVDGNDPLAVYNVTKYAREICVGQNRPVLIEAMTYRLGDHSTSDNSALYRPVGEQESFKRHNPIDRFRKYLVNNSLWDNEKEKDLRAAAIKESMDAIDQAAAHPKPTPENMFTDVYDEMPDLLQKQRDEMKQYVEMYKEHFPVKQFEKWV